MTTQSQLRIGTRVKFTPKNQVLAWAEGTRTVSGFDLETGAVKLKCGDIKLLARYEELDLVFEK